MFKADVQEKTGIPTGYVVFRVQDLGTSQQLSIYATAVKVIIQLLSRLWTH